MSLIKGIFAPFLFAYVLSRNLLILKPIAWISSHQVEKFLLKNGHTGFWFNNSIGLLNADGLCLSFFVSNDADAESFSKNELPVVECLFRQELSKRFYPKWAIPSVKCDVHSHETIMREGGYHLYFK